MSQDRISSLSRRILTLAVCMNLLVGCATNKSLSPESPVQIINEAITKIQETSIENSDRREMICRAIVSMNELAQAEGVSVSSLDSKDVSQSWTAFLKVTCERLVRKSDIPPEQLIDAALEGIISGLGPTSAYYPAAEVPRPARGSGGVGLELRKEDGWPVVVSVLDGSPAAKNGISPGNRIVRLEDRSTQNMSLVEAVRWLTGPVGSTVVLEIESNDREQPLRVELTREKMIHETVVCTPLPGEIDHI